MKALFKVTFMDAKGNSNMESFNVIAANASDAIRKASALKSLKSFRPEEVTLIAEIDK